MGQTPQPFQLSLAPQQLWQSINPWFQGSSGDQLGLININLGHGDDQTERNILAQVGSYGKQIGHLGDALEVILGVLHVIAPEKMAALSQPDKDKLTIALADVAAVRQVKLHSGKHPEQPAQAIS
jgi:hypothetical protein